MKPAPPLFALLAATLALAGLGPPAARASWTAPRAAVGATPYAEDAGVFVGAGGAELAWFWSPRPPDHVGPVSLASRDSVGAGWTARGDLRGPAQDVSLQPFGRSRVAASAYRYPARRGLPVTLLDSSGRSRGRFVLDRHYLISGAQFAASPRGRTVAAWHRRVRRRLETRVIVAPRLRGSHFGRPVYVSGMERVVAEMAAVNDRGDVLVVWLTDLVRGRGRELIRARLLRVDGRLGPVAKLGSVRGFAFADPSVAITSDGRGAVAWGAQNADGDQEGRPAYAAEMRRDGSFRPLRRLTSRSAIGKGRYGYDIGRVRVVASARGELVVAWTDGRPHFYAVRSATLSRGRLAQVETLSAPERDGQLLDLAADTDGSVRALWTSDWDESGENQDFIDQQSALDEESATPVELLAATRPEGGGFGIAERLSSSEDRRPIPDGALGFDPRNRRPVAVWIDGLDRQAELRFADGY
jgi:hypothetical protein